jgi:predicted negative regulator of RcsB-dependent stress response
MPHRNPHPRTKYAYIIPVLCCLWQAVATADAVNTQWEIMLRAEEDYKRHPSSDSYQSQYATAINNYAVVLVHDGKVDQAITQFERAIALAPQDTALTNNLSSLLYQSAAQHVNKRQPRKATKLLEGALRYNPANVKALLLQGDIYYDKQQLKKAERVWKKAALLAPENPTIQQQLLRVTQDRSVEDSFRRLPQSRFNIRYSRELPASAETTLREILSEAYQAIGRDFRHYAKQRITVLLYTREEFHERRQDLPEWIGGQYDGKIRLPLTTTHVDPEFKRSVWHEYTHAVIHELGQGRCPVWLNEGLAEYEGNKQKRRPYVYLSEYIKSGKEVPFVLLIQGFGQYQDLESATLAYEFASSVVAFLADRYGAWHFKRLIKALGEGEAFPDAFHREYHLKVPEQLMRKWREWAETNVK